MSFLLSLSLSLSLFLSLSLLESGDRLPAARLQKLPQSLDPLPVGVAVRLADPRRRTVLDLARPLVPDEELDVVDEAEGRGGVLGVEVVVGLLDDLRREAVRRQGSHGVLEVLERLLLGFFGPGGAAPRGVVGPLRDVVLRVVGLLGGRDAVGRWGAEPEGFRAVEVARAEARGARRGADREEGGEDGDVDRVEDELAGGFLFCFVSFVGFGAWRERERMSGERGRRRRKEV